MLIKNKLLSFLFLITILFGILSGQSAIDIAKNCLPSTVFITMEDQHHQPLAIGSGFIVGEGKIITNLHVIEGAKFGYVLLIEDDTKYRIDGYFKIDELNDLAFLSVPTLSGKPLPLFDGEYPEIGERIYAIGNPKGLSGTISEGIISGIRSEGESKLIQITAPISPGSSGGPVINNSGEVVGVAVGTITSGQNLNFVIPSVNIKTLIFNIDDKVVSPLNKYNRNVKINRTIKDEEYIDNALAIRDIRWMRGFQPPFKQLPKNYAYKKFHIDSFSIINKLDYTINNIKIRIILYDKTMVPIDYYEETIFTSQNGIEPYLARTHYLKGLDVNARKQFYNEKIEIRIINFDIIRD